ncbi:MAG: tetratricopeptide repeat protein [Tannerella sp.]|jgi:tetratricopeptide (TPR) repeat protein|nr:tetratricopeptide repeat protein [Tannerella sp.]
MKNVLLIIGLSLVTVAAFGQKKAVKDAMRLAKDAKPNYNEARALIKGALDNPETKGDAETWFSAGEIEDAQFTAENTKAMLGQQPNEPVMYDALANSLPYYLEAYKLDQLPDAKGKVKPRYQKKIQGTLGANHIYYLNGGAYYFDKQDYPKACNFFEQYLEISDYPAFKDLQFAQRDSNYMIVQFYLAVASTQLDNKDVAIKNLVRAKDTPYRQHDVYQYLCYEYLTNGDTATYEKTLEEGMKVFPDSSYYLLNLIALYLGSDREEKAVQYLNTAIAQDPNNSDLYQALGSVYEQRKELDKAEANFIKSLDLAPESPVALTNVGRIYYNQAVNKLGDANLITDQALYTKEKDAAMDMFKKALPYFKKAFDIKPDDPERDVLVALRGIYYNLNMSKEFDEIDALMNK